MIITSIDAVTTANQNLYDLISAPGFTHNTILSMLTLSTNNDCTLIVNGNPVAIKAEFGLNLGASVRIESLTVVEPGVEVYAVIGFFQEVLI